MFTNTRDEDLDILYAATKRDEDDINLAQANDKLTGVDGEDKDLQATGTMIQNKATTRTQKTKKTMTAITTMMMKMMMLQKHTFQMETLTSTNKLTQSQEWIRKSQDWTAPREKSQEWIMPRELQEWMIQPQEWMRRQPQEWVPQEWMMMSLTPQTSQTRPRPNQQMWNARLVQ